ncbi:transcription factor IIIA-like protein [Leptotrombidium deliense]|uniref:Transcription factor IIIA-like protein n=1 Tax=Leptotrombidium deliense TaxID=299467 RepID=A0A443SH37_9ACAR|nr:transcription factor IIIA-like protein [Leptotrombidium deliense]
MHTSERPFICSLEGCDKSFTCINYLKKHMKRPHGVAPVVTARIKKVHECKDCGKIFKHKFDLKTHSAVHGGEKPFKCNMCSASFALKCRLKKHMKRHEGYPCKEESCDFVAESWSELVKHKSVDHKKQFKCDMCGSTFLTPGNLDNHIVTHFENEFHCSFEGCDRNFQRPSNLKIHTNAVHDREVYKCDYEGCGGVFHYKSSLLRHRRMHLQPLEKRKANVGSTRCMAAFLTQLEVTKEQNYKLLKGEAVELSES